MKLQIIDIASSQFTGKAVALSENEKQLANGVKGEAILGYLKDPLGKLEADNFVVNKSFLSAVESYFRSKEGESIATGNREEWLYVIDARSENGATPPEYIVGAYKLEQGAKAEFTMNPNYRVLTSDGFPNFGETENAEFTQYVWNHLQ